MREIKFKVWDIEEKKIGLVVGNLYMSYVRVECANDKHGIAEPDMLTYAVEEEQNSDEWITKHVRFPNFELMQFTGLSDKNGKEIYEGDIIQWGYDECKECGQEYKKKRGAVYWNEFSACYQTSNGDYLISNRGNTQLKGNRERDDLEIIGNIYENPELLNKQ